MKKGNFKIKIEKEIIIINNHNLKIINHIKKKNELHWDLNYQPLDYDL